MTTIIRRLRDQKGFTLIELLAVVAIIAVLAALAVPKVYQAINNSKTKSARADVTTIASALDQYYMDNSVYPVNLNTLVTRGYMKQTTNFLNGFGQPYFYAINANPNPTAYILADPGQVPDGVTELFRCQYDETSVNSCGTAASGGTMRTAPAGTGSTSNGVLFNAITFRDNTQAATGGTFPAVAVGDPSTWFNTFRTDIVTQ